MEYITVKDGKIAGHFNGETLPKGAYEVNGFMGYVGEPVSFYNQETWERLPQKELYLKGLLEVPAGYKINSTKTDIEELSIEEKVAAHLISQRQVDADLIEKDEQYLKNTDWYVIRAKEVGKDVPSEVLTERQRCRDEISTLRERSYNNEGNLVE